MCVCVCVCVHVCMRVLQVRSESLVRFIGATSTHRNSVEIHAPLNCKVSHGHHGGHGSP